ncbi:hypothetical protein [Serratia proteamaculans]
MNIKFEEMNELDYFELDGLETSCRDEIPVNNIVIDQSERALDGKSKVKIKWNAYSEDMNISFIQFEHKYFNRNIAYLINLIRLAYLYNNSINVTLTIYSNNYTYYSNEIRSTIFTSTKGKLKSSSSYRRILLVIFIRNLVGDKLSRVLHKIFNLMKRVVRK